METFRHTGVRIEELLEITHRALSTYRLPDTGQTVPLLQIVPSKNDEERLLLVSPELASVLATIITRLRDAHGAIPLVAATTAPNASPDRGYRTCSNAKSATGTKSSTSTPSRNC